MYLLLYFATTYDSHCIFMAHDLKQNDCILKEPLHLTAE